MPCNALLGVGRVESADKDHDVPPWGRASLMISPACLSCGDVVSSDVARTIARNGDIAVLRDYQGLCSGGIDHRRLIGWIDWADGNAFDALRKKIIDDPLLFSGSSIRVDPEFHVNVGNFCILLSRFPFARSPRSLTGLFVTKASLRVRLPPLPLSAGLQAEPITGRRISVVIRMFLMERFIFCTSISFGYGVVSRQLSDISSFVTEALGKR